MRTHFHKGFYGVPDEHFRRQSQLSGRLPYLRRHWAREESGDSAFLVRPGGHVPQRGERHLQDDRIRRRAGNLAVKANNAIVAFSPKGIVYFKAVSQSHYLRARLAPGRPPYAARRRDTSFAPMAPQPRGGSRAATPPAASRRTPPACRTCSPTRASGWDAGTGQW